MLYPLFHSLLPLDSAVNIPVPPATKEITLRNDQSQLLAPSKLTVSETTQPPTGEIVSEIEALSNSGVSAEESIKDLQRKLHDDATPTTTAASNEELVLKNPGDLNTDKNMIPERSLLENGADSKNESKNQNEKAKKTIEYSANKASEIQYNIPLTSEFTANTTPSQGKR